MSVSPTAGRGVVVCACDLSSWELEAGEYGEFKVVPSEFKASLGSKNTKQANKGHCKLEK